MIDILNKYLILCKSINIPGIGSIFIDTLPASTDFVNKQIQPPHIIYRFDKYFDSPDKDFFNYLASSKNIPDYEAIKLYNQFAQDIRSAIKTEERVLWKEVGYFSKNASGDIEFQPLEGPHTFFEALTAERVLRNNVSHAVLVGDKEKTSVEMTEFLHVEKKQRFFIPQKTWKWPALILSAIALIVLIIHFSVNGFNWKSAANQQPVKFIQPAGR